MPPYMKHLPNCRDAKPLRGLTNPQKALKRRIGDDSVLPTKSTGAEKAETGYVRPQPAANGVAGC